MPKYTHFIEIMDVNDLNAVLVNFTLDQMLALIDKAKGEYLFSIHKFKLSNTFFSLQTLFTDKKAQPIHNVLAGLLGENHMENWRFLCDLAQANLTTHPHRSKALNDVIDKHLAGLNIAHALRKALHAKRGNLLNINDFSEVITETVSVIRGNMSNTQRNGNFNSVKLESAVEHYNPYNKRKPMHGKSSSMGVISTYHAALFAAPLPTRHSAVAAAVSHQQAPSLQRQNTWILNTSEKKPAAVQKNDHKNPEPDGDKNTVRRIK